MKPHTLKGRTKSPAESGQMSPAEHVLERIKTLTVELHAVQVDIYNQTADPADMLARRMILEHQAGIQVLDEFRAALDQIRNILWVCTEEAGGNPDNRHRRHQLARAGALLRTSSADSRAATAPLRRQTAETVSFFDRLDRVIDTYMQEGGTIVNPKPAKRPKS